MYRIVSMRISLVFALFLGGLFCCQSHASSSEEEIYIMDHEGNYWRPSMMSEDEAYAESERQKTLPLKKRLSMRPDYAQYNPETGMVWQRVYPAPFNNLEEVEDDAE